MADQTACYMGRWRTDSGCVTALVLRGRKRLHLVTIGYPIAVAHPEIAEERHIRPLANLNASRCAKTFLKLGRTNGITAGAKHVLKRAQAGAA